MLADSELRDIWIAADKLGGPYAALIKLLMLTGQRRDRGRAHDLERGRSGSPHVEAAERAQPRTAEPHDIPLSGPAVAILEALPRIGDTFVLTTDGKSAASNYSANRQQLDALLPANMPRWWLHDLRRTMASGMARLGVNLPVIERVLNHTSGSFAGVVGVYQRHDFADQKRHALERWGAHVADLVSGRHRENIIRLEPRA